MPTLRVLRLLALLVQKAQILTRTAAELGYAEAMYFLGKAHAAGKYNLPGRYLRDFWTTQCTCFTGTKVQILTPKELRAASDLAAVEWLARASEAGHAQAQVRP